ncbi:pyrroline-5-carboxylate reductase [Janthinobacterium agaricidamnosum NBRC 102515 = DSM 9628]|uniref:Pyrroline-5-carboxylate reductase n=1 Tax=Janthinobacterium agaricidamnosum NBRC 102515 = DSM 9628 TaxID=1349767 RepID=W0V8J9_9BURK|nr:pyrroline-5-carboxylate reductase [Janthinobacterium agaricidamnosum NBRC 102515 = DSM 9628]
MKIAFVGGGNMASALIAGLAGKLTPGRLIHVIDPHPDALDKLHTQFGVTTAHAASAVLSGMDVIVLAVKPQSMREVAAQLLPYLEAAQTGKAPLVLSIAAGIRAADLSRWLGAYGAIVRCMPNTPALIGLGITGMVASPGVGVEQKEAADAILKAVGATVWLDSEDLIDPVTAVSGSGPAYVFYFIEAMQAAAAELGLNAEQGRQLALATFVGASQLAAQSSEPVSLLRERVTSKGGTTHAALSSMENSGIKQEIVEAVKAAARRGKELGDELGRAG